MEDWNLQDVTGDKELCEENSCREIQLSKFVITIGNKIIISKVLEKAKAEEKYTDTIFRKYRISFHI